MIPFRYRPGDQFGEGGQLNPYVLRGQDADRLNEVRDELERLAKWRATPPLDLSDGPDGRNLSLSSPRPFPARLSGSTSPYSFAEVVATSGGGWATLSGGRTGTSNAYEVNSVGGLNDKVARLELGWAGTPDYRFQWVAGGGSSGGPPTPVNCGSCTLSAASYSFTPVAPPPGGSCDAIYVAGTVTWGPSPVAGQPAGYWSGTMAPSANDVFYYGATAAFFQLRCSAFSNAELHEWITTGGGSTLDLGVRGGSFAILKPGDACSPLHLTRQYDNCLVLSE